MSLGALGRRQALLAGAALAFASKRGFADAAAPSTLSFHLPWPASAIDPHRIDDATAAILGAALFEPLYVLTDSGAVVPAIAETEPEPVPAGLRVAIRGGIRTAHDRPLDARDVAWSLSRARGLGGRGWLAELPAPHLDGRAALVFATSDVDKLLRVLSSPLAAVLPSRFAPDRPDGTGPFRAERRGDALVLVRRDAVAQGTPLVDEVVVRPSADLAAPLRAFEAGEDSVGWLGAGLHEPRAGARSFDLGAAAWAVLRTGREAGTWDAPGIAQRIADGIPYARVSYLALGAPWSPSGEAGWGGAACDLLVRDDAPWLVELARAVAATITRPGHEVTVKTAPAADVAARRASRAYSLLLDVARPLAPTPLGAFVGLATADDPATVADIAAHAPRLDRTPNASPRTFTRTMRLGVVGEVRVQGAVASDVTLAVSPQGGLDLAGATKVRVTP